MIGTGVGAITQGFLSARGPAHGVPQMVLSRLGFGYWGNAFPAGLNAVTAGIGWFAVNSVSGTFALNTLTHLPKPLCLVIIVLAQIVIAFFGHNLVQLFERYAFPVLAIIFVVATIVDPHQVQPGRPVARRQGPAASCSRPGAAFGYAVGWNPYAADYTRYFPPDTSKKAIALWSGLGLFLSCAILEIAGAASATITGVGAALGNPTGAFTGHLPTALADLTLLAIAIGAIAANVLNIYSGALSFTAMGIKLPLALRRAIVALVFGVIGFIVALTGLHDAGHQVRELPADHRLLDRALAGRGVLRPVPAPPQPLGEIERLLFDTQVPQLGRAGGDAGRRWGCRSGCSPTRPSTSAWSPSTCPPSATSPSRSASSSPP